VEEPELSLKALRRTAFCLAAILSVAVQWPPKRFRLSVCVGPLEISENNKSHIEHFYYTDTSVHETLPFRQTNRGLEARKQDRQKWTTPLGHFRIAMVIIRHWA
jgi:hypothetical protein